MRRWTVGLACVLSVAAAGCSQRFQSSVDSASVQAGRIEHLFWLIFWVTLIVFVLVMGALTIGTIRARVPSDIMPPPMPNDPQEDRRTTRVVAGATIATIVTLFVLLGITVKTLKAVGRVDTNSPVSIQVTGHQWWWEVNYQNSRADMVVTTANEIHVPVGVPVVINTASRDVIHSFWAPNIQGKRDLIPGYTTAFWFQAEREGMFRGQCAEFCGHQHAHMGFLVIAESKDKFEQWIAQQRQAAQEPKDPVAARGQQVFTTGPCAMCHTIRGTIAGSRVGPDLTHLASRSTIGAATLPNTRGNLAGWIVNSQSVKPGNRMPPISMASEDLQALLTYLETLK